MVVKVLKSVTHTYRYYLELFFYVLIWIYAYRAWEREFECEKAKQPNLNRLRRWYTGIFIEIVAAKLQDLGRTTIDVGFKGILIEFPGAFNVIKLLCRNIRGILFPRDLITDFLVYETPESGEILYKLIFRAY